MLRRQFAVFDEMYKRQMYDTKYSGSDVQTARGKMQLNSRLAFNLISAYIDSILQTCPRNLKMQQKRPSQ